MTKFAGSLQNMYLHGTYSFTIMWSRLHYITNVNTFFTNDKSITFLYYFIGEKYRTQITILQKVFRNSWIILGFVPGFKKSKYHYA